MSRKVFFADDIVKNVNHGLARPKADIKDAPVLEVNTNNSRPKARFAFFVLGTGEGTETWGARVSDLMGIENSPVQKDKEGVFMEIEGLYATIPASQSQPITFRRGK